jgi:hypothetical protein
VETGLVSETSGVYVPVSRAALGQNYPNPFNPSTKIEYWVPEVAKAGERMAVNVTVYDVRGARCEDAGVRVVGARVTTWRSGTDATTGALR